MTLRAWVDSQDADQVPVDDRGLLYGDGVFETIAIHRGGPLLLDAHLARMRRGCERLGFASLPSEQRLRHDLTTVSEGLERGVVKLVVTRGSGPRGYQCAPDHRPRTVVTLHEWPEQVPHRKSGLVVGICDLRLGQQTRLAGIKHLNRLEQVLARSEWQSDWHEGLLLNQVNCVISGTQSNFFVVQDHVLVTPPILDNGVAGIMRATVLEYAKGMDIRCQERVLAADELPSVKQAFMTNSVMGIAPVKQLAGRSLEIGSITRRLQACLDEKHCVVPG